MTQPIQLETDRLLLRQWREPDLEPFARLNADPVVMEHFPAPQSRAESDAAARRFQTTIERDGYGLWALEVRGGDDFIGFVGLAVPRWDLPFMPCTEIGWRLARSAWGNGYATEAALAVLDCAFGTIGLDQVVSFTATTNLRSQRVMERIGMHRDPGEDFDHPALPEGHRLRRHVLYRIP
jgi:RimJ/RimL family protein N-acetyltransferase